MQRDGQSRIRKVTVADKTHIGLNFAEEPGILIHKGFNVDWSPAWSPRNWPIAKQYEEFFNVINGHTLPKGTSASDVRPMMEALLKVNKKLETYWHC